jgi:hypothetical protein
MACFAHVAGSRSDFASALVDALVDTPVVDAAPPASALDAASAFPDALAVVAAPDAGADDVDGATRVAGPLGGGSCDGGECDAHAPTGSTRMVATTSARSITGA